MEAEEEEEEVEGEGEEAEEEEASNLLEWSIFEEGTEDE